MRLREFDFATDAMEIDQIFRSQPDIDVPSLRHTYDNAVAENSNGRLLAYGVLKEFAEAVLIINRESTRKREKAAIIKLVISRAIKTCKKNHLEKLIIITEDESYSKVLEKRWGFKEIQGKVLSLEIE